MIANFPSEQTSSRHCTEYVIENLVETVNVQELSIANPESSQKLQGAISDYNPLHPSLLIIHPKTKAFHCFHLPLSTRLDEYSFRNHIFDSLYQIVYDGLGTHIHSNVILGPKVLPILSDKEKDCIFTFELISKSNFEWDHFVWMINVLSYICTLWACLLPYFYTLKSFLETFFSWIKYSL